MFSCGDASSPWSPPPSGLSTHAQALETPAVDVEGLVDAEVQYERIILRDAERNEVSRTQWGELTPAIWQRVARPWTHDTEDEPWLYHEDATGAETTPEGLTRSVYRILREPNHHPRPPSTPDIRPLRVDPVLQEQLITYEEEKWLDLHLKIRDFPRFDIPLNLPEDIFTMEEIERNTAERTQAIEERKALLEDMSTDLQSWILAQGGSIVGAGWTSGWLYARLQVRQIEGLMGRGDIVALASGMEKAQPACDVSCTPGYSSDVKLGDLRDEERIGSDYFLLNSTVYDAALLDAAVLEEMVFEDEAWAFKDTSYSGSTRINGRYDCSGASCVSVSNFSDNDSNSSHGTVVSSILLADYEDNQASSVEYGDSCWDDVSHCNSWKRAASGAAPEAFLYFLGYATSPTPMANAIETSISHGVDVISISHELSDGACDPASSRAREDNAEDAFDDGILVVVAAGNNNAGGSATCDIRSPSDTHKVLAINATDMSDADCEDDYQDCPLDVDKHRKGGATLTIDGDAQSTAYSGIDIVAPNRMRYPTVETGNEGVVAEGQRAIGTSAATPFTAGSALLVKDWLLTEGETWISSPGRLHTVMLSMADRYEGVGTPSYRTTATDSLWGMGRLKLRLLEDNKGLGDVFWKMSTYTRTTTGTTTYLFNTSPIPNGTDLFKCVLMEDEDFSGHSDAGDVYLWVVLKNPVSGTCSSGGSTITSRTDSTYDLKHFVAFEDSDQNVEGVCPEINVVTGHIADSSITFHVFCYYAGELDRDPH